MRGISTDDTPFHQGRMDQGSCCTDSFSLLWTARSRQNDATVTRIDGEIGILESVITSETVAELVTADQTLEVIPPFIPKGNSGNDEQVSTQSSDEADNKTQLFICNIATSII